ncbi:MULTISPECIES: ABC transporter ATP-binding protein [Mycobacteriaceae]|uniref:ABC transporter ATP-binding protein n=1 Tax=Mycobacteriaceae TaxID=1762 RepID=UPI000800511F|nr:MULTISPECIES: ATP-binding cassette domain-containing protein [Mycobacteriaceae]MCK0174719.1 ATP-binding cassette domain-containing protein [Mycolicibacterium sp. F2034L]OBB59155.1 ABC transporter ATP-binding protein [Mycobacterium sp. 852013-51886_SCH5428379]
MSDPVLLHAQDIAFVRGGRYLLADVSVAIEAGQSWVVLGPNGAGKSTLLNLFGAIAHPTSGTVHVLGHQLGRVDMRELRTHIGHVNPRHRVDSPLTARQVVLTGLTNTPDFIPRWAPTGAQVRRAEELIGSLGLADRADTPWQVMSQGERGRTLIARALIGEPHLLILDEPATGLDLAAREQLLAAMDGLRHSDPQLATVLVTHHIEEIPATTSHALLLRAGRVVAQGPAPEVLTSEAISACFDHPININTSNGRWFAQAAPA